MEPVSQNPPTIVLMGRRNKSGDDDLFRPTPQRHPSPYFIVGITKAESSLIPSGQRAVMVLTLV